MTELSIRPEEIRDALQKYVDDYKPSAASREEVGTVAECADGIARVAGLPSAMANELLEFEDGTLGIALNLDTREIGVVVLGDFDKIEEGQTVRRTGEILSVPVGDAFMGRVIDPLGTPIDGLGEIASDARRALELQAPGVMHRKSVHEPLATGIKAIDSMTPIGRGQRQLIIGDRSTGKTTIAIDTIINQKQNWETGDPAKQVRCIYVAIGQKGSTIAAVRGALEEAGALEYTTIVASPASDSAGFKYLAPYTGSAIGQHWMYDGKHVLIVFDDLTKQAEAYRAVSLLLRRPPGREAYPGDVFYLHSRLLERCAKLSDALGAGSMTGLPIIETKANDVSAYIPTNVISITDGQIFLQSDLFAANQRPAIDVGVSVSRVGGNAMTKAMKSVTGSLKVDLAQFRAMEAFAMFASDLDAASRQQLDRGQRLMALLKQPQYSPYPLEEMVISLWLGTTGKLDRVPTGDVLRFENEFLDFLRRSHADLLDGIRESQKFEDDTAAKASRRTTSSSTSSRPRRASPSRSVTRRRPRPWPTRSSSRRRSSSRSGVRRVAVSLREYRARIKSVESTKKITRAMELIAASRIIKAQQRAQQAAPYARELTRAVSALVTYSNVKHPLTTEPENPRRAAVLIVTSDRGLAGAYSSSVLKEAERLAERLRAEGKEVVTFITGRKGEAYYRFRNRPVRETWTGFSDQPRYENARAIGEALISAFVADTDSEDGVDEVHLVYTQFRSMLVQDPHTVRMLPLEVVEGEAKPEGDEVLPLYEFEPSPQSVLDELLPKYVQSRIFFALLQASASELAARQKAMKSATDNAEELIKKYTQIANQARQAGITQEISEIVGGVNALADANAAAD